MCCCEASGVGRQVCPLTLAHKVRQALLEELQHCATVLSGFLAARKPESEPVSSNMLVELLRGLSQCRPRPRMESFATVAAQIKLISSLFADVGRHGGQGSKLLLWSVDQILTGHLVLQGYCEEFYCRYSYRVAGEERAVTVSSTNLKEYSTRSLMSLEGLKEQRDKFDLLQAFLEKVREIVANDTGLVATAAQLHKAGHPKFRRDVEISMAANLAMEAQAQLETLGSWKEEVRSTLEAAPLLGLVPQSQLHAWLAQVHTDGLTPEVLGSMVEGLSIWTLGTSEGFDMKLLNSSIPFSQALDASASLAALCVCCEDLEVALPGALGQVPRPGPGRFKVQAKDSDDALKKCAHLFLAMEGGPNRLPRPSEVLFCDDRVSVDEVQAFLWRSQRFPQLLFVLVEPNRLPAEGKKRIAEWLASEDVGERNSSLGMILTSSWYIPASARVREMQVRPDQAVQIWQDQCPAEVLIYRTEQGTGPSSGKSTYIRHRCELNNEELVSCMLHEGFQLSQFIAESRRQILECCLAGRRIALHVEVNAYSDWELSNAFLRHLLLCQVLFDPASGQMASLPDGTRIHVEIGAIAGKRDLHSLRQYATEETMQARFPQEHKDGIQLTLSLLYPILEIVGRDVSFEVSGFPLQRGELHYLPNPHDLLEEQVHARVVCSSCGAMPVRGACYTCQVCLDVDLCAACYAVHEHDPSHGFRVRQATALPFGLMQASLQPHPLEESRRLPSGRINVAILSDKNMSIRFVC